MDNDFIHLENDLILNIDRISFVAKKKNPIDELSHVVIMGGTVDNICITQKDYDVIKNYLFGFHPDYGSNDADAGKEVIREVLSETIDFLGIGPTTCLCLENEGIKTISDIVKYSARDLRGIRKVGTGTINKIANKLNEMGLSLKGGGK